MAGCGPFGELSQAGRQETVMDSGQEHRGVKSMVGDLVAVSMDDLRDEAVSFQSSQVIGHLPGADLLRW